MTALWGTKYAGFILGAYGITFAVLLAMTLWVVLTARSRRNVLKQLEAEGMRRVGSAGVDRKSK